MRRTLLPTTLLALLLAASACRTVAPDGQGGRLDRAADTRAVYLAVLEQMWTRESTTRYVIDPMALREEVTDGYQRTSLERLHEGTLRDFARANRRERPMPRDLDAPLPITWLDTRWGRRYAQEAKARGIDSLEAIWTVFHERHPGSSGYLTFSGVGFSPDGLQALVGTSGSSASLSGAGYLVLLRYEAGAWVVVDKVSTWVS